MVLVLQLVSHSGPLGTTSCFFVVALQHFFSVPHLEVKKTSAGTIFNSARLLLEKPSPPHSWQSGLPFRLLLGFPPRFPPPPPRDLPLILSRMLSTSLIQCAPGPYPRRYPPSRYGKSSLLKVQPTDQLGPISSQLRMDPACQRWLSQNRSGPSHSLVPFKQPSVLLSRGPRNFGRLKLREKTDRLGFASGHWYHC